MWIARFARCAATGEGRARHQCRGLGDLFRRSAPRDYRRLDRRRFELCLSPLIFDEYTRVCDRLGVARAGLEYRELLAALVGHGTLVPDLGAAKPITADADDDKFMLCAQKSGAAVVSGDKHLLDVAGWKGITVMRPREFLALLNDERS